MQAVRAEAFPFAAGRSDAFYAGRTPFNVLWPRAVRELAFVRAMPPGGPYNGLSPISSTVGQLQSWSKIIGSTSWLRRYGAAADAQRIEDRDERSRQRRMVAAKQSWIRDIDPVMRFSKTATGRDLFARTSRRRQEKSKCENRAWIAQGEQATLEVVRAVCEETVPYLRRTAIRRILLHPRSIFPFSYAELAEVDPLAYADPDMHRLDFSASRFFNEDDPGAIRSADASTIRRTYGREFSYAEMLAGFIVQLHAIAQRVPGILDSFGPRLMQLLVLLHQERQNVFTYAARDAFPTPIA